MVGEDRYLPALTGTTAAYFELLDQTGVLHVQHCVQCGGSMHPIRETCPRCWSFDLHFLPSSGRGVVFSHSRSWTSAEPFWQARVPFTTVTVEIDGVRMIALLDRSVDDVVDGSAVQVAVEPTGHGYAYLVASPL